MIRSQRDGLNQMDDCIQRRVGTGQPARATLCPRALGCFIACMRRGANPTVAQAAVDEGEKLPCDCDASHTQTSSVADASIVEPLLAGGTNLGDRFDGSPANEF